MGRALWSLVIAGGLLVSPASAHAQFQDDETILVSIFASMGAAVGSVGGTVTGIANPIYVGSSRRPPTGWMVTGSIFGGLGALSGVGLMALGASERAEEVAVFGGVSMAIGLYNMIMVLLGSRMPDLTTAAGPVAVSPSLGPDGRGGTHVGMNLTIGAF